MLFTTWSLHRVALQTSCLASLAVVLLAMTGCNGASGGADHPPTYPVTGKVLYKDQPVADAMVSFRSGPAEKAVAAAGKTDANGNFELTSFEPGDGAVAGEHKVIVVKTIIEGEDPSYFDTNSPNYGKTPPKTTKKFLVPEKYSKFESSGLTATVKDSGTSEVTLELKD